MKKLLLMIGIMVSSILTNAQVYQINNLDLEQAQYIRGSVLSMTGDPLFWQNDSLISIIKDIDKQVLAKATTFSVKLNWTAMKKVIGDSMGGLSGNLSALREEKNRANSERKKANTKIGIIKSIREYEKTKKIANKNSVFERLNTGFLQDNDFNSIDVN